MISALAWVRKGVAAEKPTTYTMTEDEYSRLQSIAKEEINEAKKELKERAKTDDTIMNDPALKDFDLENYDTDEEGSDDGEEADVDKQNVNLFSNIKGLAYYDDNQEDPYITVHGEEDPAVMDQKEEEEEVRILGSDSLLLVAKTEDDVSNLEVCVLEGDQDNMFVHHDFMLSSFPLAVEWLDYRVGRKAGQEGGGNYVAVATFEPHIEIWDLDTMESMYPDLVLGANATQKKAQRKTRGKPHSDFHTDAVMGLSWNKNVRNLLASSSADKTVKLWDLAAAKCVQSYNHHKDKVQAVKWHPSEASVMLTGGYDKRVGALDSRAPAAISWWAVDDDVESIMWDAHSPSHFYVATEAGTIRYFDLRTASSGKGSDPIYTLVAHDEAVSAMDQHPTIPGLLVTGSADETVKVWDVRNNKPSMVVSRNLDVGNVFATVFCPDEPMLVAVGGSSGEPRIWDISSNADVRQVFGDAIGARAAAPKRALIGLQNDEENDDESRDAIISEMYGAGGAKSTPHGDDDASMASDSDN
ncbi:rRNA-processing protein [Coemansia sp. RSA 1813]|nr:rRNA-processing protein [Coemansia sp. RSA 1646]KAJ1766451.1 rRNA-processing protein [Coemansia sp. RSA 1843]KAJ2088010.1 rRNA-processing protein [Coemansia sp. RSA 986]KAJ2212647.1 rRNA-processing protein [Coemansia sp. RSA 487]KAJ2567342.1 rRNA-processing protein [Coemansia sp. RSA 1813]